MGGKPLFALNIVGFPSNRLPLEVLEEILKGAQFIADKAGISIIGGHTIDDTEPKFGWAVTGIIKPNKVVKNSTALVGDYLVLTKPIGTGILSTALKQNMLSDDSINELKEVMMELNMNASEAMMEIGVNACTDITGFGLMGHLLEMTTGSNTSAKIYSHQIPILNRVLELAVSGIIPGGTKNNYDHTLKSVYYSNEISDVKKIIFNDAQTSGGLLISVAHGKLEKLLKAMSKRDVRGTAVIGNIIPVKKAKIIIE